MRHIVLAVSYAVALLVTPASAIAADAGACYSVSDQDQRTYCLARAHRDPAICYGIQSTSLRAQCRAEVQR